MATKLHENSTMKMGWNTLEKLVATLKKQLVGFKFELIIRALKP